MRLVQIGAVLIPVSDSIIPVRRSMPLVKSPSKGAFKSNLKAELGAGKPQKQALAIAYSVKRRSNRKSSQRSTVK